MNDPEKRLYSEINSIIGKGRVTTTNIIGITLALMQAAEEQVPPIPGILKKKVIMDALNNFVDSKVEDPQDALDLKLIIRQTIPSVIDSFVELDKGKIKIKIKNCLERLCC